MSEVTPEMLAVLDQSAGAVGLIECVEISHPNWTETLRYVVNSNEAITLTHEDSLYYEYKPTVISIQRSADIDTLEQTLKLSVGDLGEQIPDLIDLVIQDDEIIQPIVNYRAYIMGNYATPCFIVKGLLVEGVARDFKGSTIEANAAGLNDSGNGEIYSASTDPSLIGFY
ncbi:hypothetical protein [Acinetobacter venetianus]|uniref:hypothetical protein n=1 Tax=Acinetobacter venetianus TaxID=52133 RepID=UPI00214F97C8|nr:hypothetical protein [Acinetobacter venetianus]MCR4530835.1 hypothetical protein [Acinetobacter venetianus]